MIALSSCQPHAYVLHENLSHDIGEKEYELSYLGIVRVKPLLVLEPLIEEAE